MARKLTTEQWHEATAPMYWIRSDLIKHWEQVVIELCEKWLDSNIKGWYYSSGKYFVFENEQDMVTFKFFVLNNKFSDNDTHGKIEVPTP